MPKRSWREDVGFVLLVALILAAGYAISSVQISYCYEQFEHAEAANDEPEDTANEDGGLHLARPSVGGRKLREPVDDPADRDGKEQKHFNPYECAIPLPRSNDGWIALGTMLAAALAALAVFLLWGTLVATRETERLASKTLSSTRKGTRAAKKATKVTRKIGKAQARAYISVIGGQVDIRSTQRNTLRVRVDIANSGNSPAEYFSLSASVWIHIENIPQHFYSLDVLEIEEIGAKERRAKDAHIDHGVVKVSHDLIFQGATFTVRGHITYMDVFKDRHELSFAISAKGTHHFDPNGLWKLSLKPIHPASWDEAMNGKEEPQQHLTEPPG